jgi:dihydrofolate reductase
MRRIVLSIMMSTDGFVAGPGGDLEWFASDAELEAEMLDLLRRVDTMVLGRRAYDVLAAFWPGAAAPESPSAPGGISASGTQAEFAGLLNAMDKVVFSRSMAAAAWQPARVVSGDVADVVASLRATPGRDIVVFAGADIARQFLAAGVVDELHLQVAPVLLGDGLPLFAPGLPRRELRLLRATSFPSGAVLHHSEVRTT